MKNIAVAVDLSLGVEELIHKAYQMSKTYKAKVWLMHIEAPEPAVIDVNNGAEYMRAARQSSLKEIHNELDVYEKELKVEGVDTQVISVEGNITDVLLYEIDKHHIDLLIIGNRKHGFFYTTLVGSIFNDVINRINIPVLAVPI